MGHDVMARLRINCTPFPNFYKIFLNLFPGSVRLKERWGGKVKMLKSIVCTYPDFRTLPKGLKQMLVVSENLFFSEAQASCLDSQEHEKRQLWPVPQLPFYRRAVLNAA